MRSRTNATVDRPFHPVHAITTAGDRIRLTQATASKAMTPLAN